MTLMSIAFANERGLLRDFQLYIDSLPLHPLLKRLWSFVLTNKRSSFHAAVSTHAAIPKKTEANKGKEISL